MKGLMVTNVEEPMQVWDSNTYERGWAVEGGRCIMASFDDISRRFEASTDGA
jgi:hypothetical protein